MADLVPPAASPPAPPVTDSPTALATGKPQEAPAPTNAVPPLIPSDMLIGTANKPKNPRERLLSMADAENKVARKMAEVHDDFSKRDVLLNVAMPKCYLQIVAGLRAAVRDFNATLVELPDVPVARLNWYESPNVALNDAVTGDGMRVRVSRKNSYFDLMLRMISRSGKPDIPLIEGYGSIGRDLIRTETLLRIEGWVEKGQVVFWVSFDFKRRSIPVEEIPDRIVMAVASHDYSVLTRHFPESLPPDPEGEEGAEVVAAPSPVVEKSVIEPEAPKASS